MSTPLTLRALDKVYGGAVRAVDGFSLQVAAGEFVTLLGPSGSGKTTLLKMIAGFERPTAGDILLGGESVVDLPPHRRGIGMVFQNYALFPHMTVHENVAFPLSVRDAPRDEVRARVKAGLGLVRLEGLGDRYPAQLSGGQQQRVALARAVVFNPRLLLMDEPLGALDRNLREHMKAEIKRVQRELAITVVYVTHDQDEALAMSDRVAVMRDGRLVQAATGEELYGRPVDAFVARFIGESNLMRCFPAEPGLDAVRLEDGAVVPAAGGLSGHAPGWLMVRPERIRLTPAGAAGAGRWLEGVVADATFLGEATRYTVAVGGAAFTVKVQNRGDGRLAVGTRVAITWRPQDAVLLPD